MSKDKAETVANTDIAKKTDKQTSEQNANDARGPASTSTVRPWTADFLLPSIRFREPGA